MGFDEHFAGNILSIHFRSIPMYNYR